MGLLPQVRDPAAATRTATDDAVTCAARDRLIDVAAGAAIGVAVADNVRATEGGCPCPHSGRPRAQTDASRGRHGRTRLR